MTPDRVQAGVQLLDSFGRTVYAEFIKAAVDGIPEVFPGISALTLLAAVHRRGADALPVGYGCAFASKVYRKTRRTFWEHEVVEEAMLTVVMTALRGRFFLTPGSAILRAQAYVQIATLNSAKNVLRTRWRKRRHEFNLVLESADDEPPFDVADPASHEELEQTVQLSRLLHELDIVHPRAVEYAKAVIDGETTIEIAQRWDVGLGYVLNVRRVVEARIARSCGARALWVRSSCRK